MNTYDILVDTNINLQADSTGMDVISGDGGNQQIYFIIQSSPGHWKWLPQLGVGIWQYLNGTASATEIERAIRVHVESVGFRNVNIDASTFNIDSIIKVNKTELNT
jgi:hypothetical protein